MIGSLVSFAPAFAAVHVVLSKKAKVRQKFHLSQLCIFPEPALIISDCVNSRLTLIRPPPPRKTNRCPHIGSRFGASCAISDRKEKPSLISVEPRKRRGYQVIDDPNNDHCDKNGNLQQGHLGSGSGHARTTIVLNDTRKTCAFGHRLTKMGDYCVIRTPPDRADDVRSFPAVYTVAYRESRLMPMVTAPIGAPDSSTMVMLAWDCRTCVDSSFSASSTKIAPAPAPNDFWNLSSSPCQ